jgi:hypothetical protein
VSAEGFAQMTARAHAEIAGGNFSPEQKEILRAIELQGGITSALTEKNGWTVFGCPRPELADLVRRRIVAPRVLTAQPLRVVWQLRTLAGVAHNEARIASEASRLKLRDYAPGGFRLELRRELRK